MFSKARRTPQGFKLPTQYFSIIKNRVVALCDPLGYKKDSTNMQWLFPFNVNTKKNFDQVPLVKYFPKYPSAQGLEYRTIKDH